MNKGPSFARSYLEQKDPPFDEREAAADLGMLSVAAVYTASSPLVTFIRAAVLFPDWYRKVQEEIDTVCGMDRMPEVEDSASLPVLRAFLKECLRWRPVIPTGVSHELEEDDVYEGYLLPKGTRVHPLDWYLFPSLPSLPYLPPFSPRTNYPTGHSPATPSATLPPTYSTQPGTSIPPFQLHTKNLYPNILQFIKALLSDGAADFVRERI